MKSECLECGYYDSSKIKHFRCAGTPGCPGSPKHVNVKAIDDLIAKYRKEIADLRGDTLTSLMEGIHNEQMAKWIETRVIPDLESLK